MSKCCSFKLKKIHSRIGKSQIEHAHCKVLRIKNTITTYFYFPHIFHKTAYNNSKPKFMRQSDGEPNCLYYVKQQRLVVCTLNEISSAHFKIKIF